MIRPSVQINRPQIDLEKQNLRWDDWGDMEQEFPEGIDTIQSPPTLRFHVDAPDALQWDWYGEGLFWGMWSQRAKDLLWPYAQGRLRCFQTTLNCAPYYILRVDKSLALDCLDVGQSEIEYFDAVQTRVNIIKSYAICPKILTDPSIFHVPQRSDILATDSIRRIVENAGLKGFAFYDAADLYAFYGRPRP